MAAYSYWIFLLSYWLTLINVSDLSPDAASICCYNSFFSFYVSFCNLSIILSLASIVSLWIFIWLCKELTSFVRLFILIYDYSAIFDSSLSLLCVSSFSFLLSLRSVCSSLSRKYQTRVKVTNSDKHSSFLPIVTPFLNLRQKKRLLNLL